MTQIGEGVANPTTETEEPQDDKEHVKIRFCLFFDGTLNNRTNVEQRLASAPDKDLTEEERKAAVAAKEKMSGEGIEKAAVLYKKHGAKKDAEGFSNEENSYEGYYTNVAKMEPYIDNAPKYDLTLTTYIEGSGSLDKAGDKMPGYAFAIWKSGIRAKVEKGILNVVAEISSAKRGRYPFLSSFFLGLPRGRYCNVRPVSFSSFRMNFSAPQGKPLSALRRKTFNFSGSSPSSSQAGQSSMASNCLRQKGFFVSNGSCLSSQCPLALDQG
mgnify:CR=1 FL=1